MDKGLIKICVNCYPMNNVARFVTDILEEYRTKKLKEVISNKSNKIMKNSY